MSMSTHTPPRTGGTGLMSPARWPARLLSFGRPGSLGPARVGAFLEDGQLRRMFETMSVTYDLQNRILSMGRDAGWRRVLVEALRARDGELVCDMATGTGDIGIAAARRYPGARVVGVDYCGPMLDEARRKLGLLPRSVRERVDLRLGDIRRTDLPSAAGDVLTITFALRNIPDRASVLAEFHRVLKPGGRLFIMELGIPAGPAMGLLYGLYLSHILPFLGNVLSRTDYAYSYLRHSIESFPRPPRFLAELDAAGFIQARAIPLSFGIAILYRAIRGG